MLYRMLPLVAITLLCGLQCRAQASEAFATHDAVTAPLPNSPLASWADVKSPGDGRTYLVGTVNVNDSNPAALPTYSGATITSAGGVTVNALGSSSIRQVAILQITSPASVTPTNPNGILVQRYYHGATAAQVTGGLTTVARAISVYPGATSADTRIAICGDTRDATLPAGNGTNSQNSNFQASGFIAVFDGDANLLWSHLFYGNTGGGNCAITDVSIRYDGAVPTPTDIVTFCGASSFGLDTPLPMGQFSTIRAERPFLPPAAACFGDAPTGGDTDNGDEWDGIVGRLTRPHSGAGATTVEFLSVVGGSDQDVLFGIAELDADRFVVVGATGGSPRAPTQNFTFPVQSSAGECLSSAIDPIMGTVLIFDAGPIRTGGAGARLALVTSRLIGPDRVNPMQDVAAPTVARDVLVLGERIVVVGTTQDPALPVTLAFDSTFDGPSDGFIGVTTPQLLDTLPNAFAQLSYWGGSGDDGLIGVSAWTEYDDHFGVVGYRGALPARDIVCASIWLATDPASPSPNSLVEVRRHTVAGAGNEVPANVDNLMAQAFQNSLTYTDPFGSNNGGGIAVDQRFRFTLVGSANAGIATAGGGRPFTAPQLEGVRIVVDMLPTGVWRTDGTGILGPSAPVPMGVGTTTPVCALSQFGRRISSPPPPANDVDRILIDFLGTNAPGSPDVALLLDQPPPFYVIEGTWLQLGFISNPPAVISGVELWTLHMSAVVTAHLPPQGADRSIFFKIANLPMSGGALTAQFTCIVQNPIACTGGVLVASPALTFTW